MHKGQIAQKGICPILMIFFDHILLQAGACRPGGGGEFIMYWDGKLHFFHASFTVNNTRQAVKINDLFKYMLEYSRFKNEKSIKFTSIICSNLTKLRS